MTFSHLQSRLARRIAAFAVVAVLVGGVAPAGRAGEAAALAPEAREFFERKIRPVLVAECYECHGAEKQKGGLRLDSRPGWQAGGNLGDAIVPGQPGKSLLLTAIKHADPDLAMPDKAPKLSAEVIADFERWIAMGAPDPRDAPPAGEEARPAWDDLFAARKGWWSLQPVRDVAAPVVRDGGWSTHPVDRFLLAAMETRGLRPATEADARTVLRRLSFTLTGLPPEPAAAEAFAAEFARDPAAAISAQVDRLLASPHFGEHWARHWMDLVRYAETHGSEGDPPIPEAWRYRDYLIRALNADVPLDQLVREHIAGDLLPQPRVSADGINESMIGPAHLRLVEHGFQPVDTLDDQVKTIDNQIDVVTKAFQALTVSCARCHDHKFDAVSQRDYTALYGIFASVRPAQVAIDAPDRLARNRRALETLHGRIKQALAEAWLAAAATIPARLQAQALSVADQSVKMPEPKPLRTGTGEIVGEPVPASTPARTAPGIPQGWTDALREALGNRTSALHLWAKLAAEGADDFSVAWARVTDTLRTELGLAQAANRSDVRPLWDLGGDDYAQWFPVGTGLAREPARCGEFAIVAEGARILEGLAPAGAVSHRWSVKHHGLLTSPRFKIDSDYLSVRASGAGGAAVRVIIDQYPLPRNNIFPTAVLDRSEPGWVRLDTAYRKGSYAYVEFATREDLTRQFEDKNKRPFPPNEPSFFTAAEVVAHDGRNLPRAEALALLPLLEGTAPANPGELAARYAAAVEAAVRAWRDGRLAEPQRALLDTFVRRGLLPVTIAEVPAAAPLVAEYRRLEAAVPVPQRVPGVIETAGLDAPLFVRGDHLKPAAAVPRGYLAVLDPQPYRTSLSGRFELAHALANDRNPLTARVLANRIWAWVFGQGIVRTVDNFGRLGEAPSHPELLDFLSRRLVEDKWSLKQLVRLLVTTRAYRLESVAAPEAREADPGNALLSHMSVRRIEAEAIRDALLAVAGRLDPALYGPASAPAAPRRSVYLPVKRTRLDPFLQTFDAPAPFSTLGRRSETNVPAQSLLLLNSPFVREQAAAWAVRLLREGRAAPEERVRGMFATALGRPPAVDEERRILRHLEVLAAEHGVAPADVINSEAVWRDLAHAIFNLKEFIYVR